MTVTSVVRVRDIVTDAYRKIGVAADDESPTAYMEKAGVRALSRLLKAWQGYGTDLWTQAEQTLTLTTAASYTLNPVRPLRVHGARFVVNGIETPMHQYASRSDYDNIPIKTAAGRPTCFWYDRQREAALFYIWPVLAAAAGETIKITYEREIEDAEFGTVLDMPGEWWNAVVYGLASDLADDYPEFDVPNVHAKAAYYLDLALGSDRDGSLFWGEE